MTCRSILKPTDLACCACCLTGCRPLFDTQHSTNKKNTNLVRCTSDESVYPSHGSFIIIMNLPWVCAGHSCSIRSRLNSPHPGPKPESVSTEQKKINRREMKPATVPANGHSQGGKPKSSLYPYLYLWILFSQSLSLSSLLSLFWPNWLSLSFIIVRHSTNWGRTPFVLLIPCTSTQLLPVAVDHHHLS